MKDLYVVAGISKQGLHKYNKSMQKKIAYQELFFEKADRIREEHPMMGCRKMYELVQPVILGRDRFEQLLLGHGYRVKYPRNYIRTTYSQKQYYFPNLIRGLELNRINRLWQTDITYFYASGRFYYLTFIEDVYSRKIIGFEASDNLRAEANIKALEMAIKSRGRKNLSRLIHHSDKGSQYIDKGYLGLLKSLKIKISMCDTAWQNAYSERLNGIIKNEYLNAWEIKNLRQLRIRLKKAVNSYNQRRPHLNLTNKMSPDNFEKYVSQLQIKSKPSFEIYDDIANQNKGLLTNWPVINKEKRSKKEILQQQ